MDSTSVQRARVGGGGWIQQASKELGFEKEDGFNKRPKG
jgi:hypothetical protein